MSAPDYDKSPPLSVLTAMFLHGSWLHLLGNMLFLLIFGNNIEDRLGHVRFALFYVACGYAAGYGFALLNDSSADPLLGASGAIAGVLGAYLVLYPRARVWVLVPFLVFLPLRLPAWLVLGFWFALQAVYSSGGGVSTAGTVAYEAHVVSFLAGMLLAWPLRRGTRRRRNRAACCGADRRGTAGEASARRPGVDVVHEPGQRVRVHGRQDSVAEVEDVALQTGGGVEHLAGLGLHGLGGREEDGRVQVALERLAGADPACGLVERHAPVDADHVRARLPIRPRSSPVPTPKWMRGTPYPATDSKTLADAGITERR